MEAFEERVEKGREPMGETAQATTDDSSDSAKSNYGPGPAAADQPCAHDTLNRSHYVEALAGLISHKQTEVPLTIGMYGPWGSGKSSMLMQLKSHLKHKHHSIVELNPWRFGEREGIWLALIQGVASALDKQLGYIDRVRLLFRQGKLGTDATFVNGIKARALASAKKFHNWLIALVSSTGIISINSDTIAKLTKTDFLALPSVKIVSTELDKVIPSFLGFGGNDVCGLLHPSIALPVLFWAFVAIAVFKLGKTLLSPLSTQIEAYRAALSKDKNNLRKLGYEELDAVRKIVKNPANKVSSKKNAPIVIFIDDLDRCSPNRIVELLESIHLCLADLPFVTVLAVDSGYVAKAVAHRYKFVVGRDASNSEKEEYGLLFLQKIVNIPFQIPAPRSIDQYLENLVQANIQAEDNGEPIPEGINPDAWKDIFKEGIQIAKKNGKRMLALNYKLLLLFKPRAFKYSKQDFTRAEWDEFLLSLKAQLKVPFNDQDQATLNTLGAHSRSSILALLELEGPIFRPRGFKEVHSRILRQANLEISTADKQILDIYSADLQGNPRSIKRFFNIYRLAKSIHSQLPEYERADMSDLTSWLVAFQNWPRWTATLSREISKPGTTIDEFLNQPPANIPEEMLNYVRHRLPALVRANESAASMEITHCFSFLTEEA